MVPKMCKSPNHGFFVVILCDFEILSWYWLTFAFNVVNSVSLHNQIHTQTQYRPCQDACWVMAQLNLNTSQGLDCADRAWPAESDRPRGPRLAVAWPRNSDSLRHQGSYWDTPQDSSRPLGKNLWFMDPRSNFPYISYILGGVDPLINVLNRAFSNRAPKRQVVHFEVFILYCKSFEVPIHFIRPSSLCFWGFL